MFTEKFTPLDLILVIAVCISLPFYCLVLAVIVRYRHVAPFKDSSFFLLCLILGAVDCLALLWVYVWIKMPMWGVASGVFLAIPHMGRWQYSTGTFLAYMQYQLVAWVRGEYSR